MKKQYSELLSEILSTQKELSCPTELSSIPFIDAVYPWIEAARNKLEEKASGRLSLLEKEALHAQEKFLLQRWSDIATTSFLLELEIKKLQDSLNGSSSRERYLDFIKNSFLDKEVLRSFFKEYELLAEKIAIFMDLWVEETAKFLERLEKDLPLLEQTFNEGKKLGKVASLQMNAGDVHQGGKAVQILTFSSGIKIVYKPKDLGIIQTFNAFLEDLNHHGLSPVLKGYTVLPKEDYGWEEFVEHKPIADLSQADLYFQRAGMCLCLLFLLEGRDAHHENIIASGEFPILIDLETLLHPTMPDFETKGVEEVYLHSVLATGLLPSFEIGKERGRATDLSGLGAKDSDATINVFRWKNINTDEMFLSQEEVKLDASTSDLVLGGKNISADDYVESIVAGFEKAYSFLEQHRTLFLSWLDKLAVHPVRFVMRATRVYYLLLKRLHTPQVFLDRNLFDTEIQILERLWTDRGKTPIAPILEEEKSALILGDIPSFQAFPNSRDFYSGATALVSNFFLKTTYDIVRKRIEEMNRKEEKLQALFIRHSFLAKKRKMHLQDIGTAFSSDDHPYSQEEVLASAKFLAHHLRGSAYLAEDGNLGWLSLHPNATLGLYTFRPVDFNFYSGKSGIALFFAALASITKEKKWEEETLLTLKDMREFIKNAKGKNLAVLLDGLGMSGIGGIIYALYHTGKLLNNQELVQEAFALIDEIDPNEIQKDVDLDIIGGSAGLILVLLSLYKESKNQKFLDLAKSCGHQLCQSALETEEGALAWKNSHSDPYIGFAHGTAGISYALFKLYELCPEEKFLQVAKAAQLYEKNHFCTNEKGWPVTPSTKEYWTAWCHGAIGIGMSRLQLLPLGLGEEIKQDFHYAIDAALKALEERKTPLNLCCGILGQLEFLLDAKKVFPDEKIENTIQRTVSSLISHINQIKPIDSHFGSSCDDPSFMKGTAGLGYTLLRVIDKEKKLPQVLLFS